MKKRTITLMLSILAVAMLVGVGFATWVISQGAGQESTGNIYVETVVDNRLGVTVTSDKTEIVFGAPTNASEGWVTSDNSVGDETRPVNLQVVFTVTVKKLGSDAFTSVDEVDIKSIFEVEGFTKPHDNLVTLGVTNTVVKADENTAMVSVASEQKSFVDDNTKDTVIAQITVTYAWGALFDEKNPYEFFNAAGISANTALPKPEDAEDPDYVALANAAGLKNDENKNFHYAQTEAEVAADKPCDTYGELARASLDAIAAAIASQVEATFKLTVNVAFVPQE